ncbi:sigma-70 family RNA polymerase sigma factor [Rubrivivax sp. JA1026]|uniref:sigma-70 family RNA polymerase sigma factor n=1 Tax=Rubrivivax sp. JA1026 TaxID=2710888 RepID=UPI0013E9885A|nr:sigma-70 family RNA polymerase sigma factor [Rubrivivax sp. JA1026]
MASDASTPSATSAVRFSPDFLDHLPSYQKAIRGQRIANWARQRGLEEDLVQLALLDLARVESRFDPARAASAHHYRMAVLPSRVSDCVDALMRLHSDFVTLDEERADSDFADDETDRAESEEEAFQLGDPVFAIAMRRQCAEALCVAIAALPSVQRRVLELALADYTDREIAEELGVSVQAVCTARGKGTAKVQAALDASHSLN